MVLITHTHTPYYCSSSLASFGWHNIVHFRLCSNDFFSISVPHSITRYKINDFNFFFLLDLIMNQTNMWLCVCVYVVSNILLLNLFKISDYQILKFPFICILLKIHNSTRISVKFQNDYRACQLSHQYFK